MKGTVITSLPQAFRVIKEMNLPKSTVSLAVSSFSRAFGTDGPRRVGRVSLCFAPASYFTARGSYTHGIFAQLPIPDPLGSLRTPLCSSCLTVKRAGHGLNIVSSCVYQ